MSDKTNEWKHVDPYTDDEIEQRFLALVQECQNYLTAINKQHPSWNMRFDPYAMLSVAKSALDDIWRYKIYHLGDPEKLSDSIKRSAYFTKWIVRTRPIYSQQPTDDDAINGELTGQNGRSLMLNETFAIMFSLITLATELGVQKIYLDENFHSNLIYDLHYRDISADALLSIYEIIRNAAERQSVVMRVL